MIDASTSIGTASFGIGAILFACGLPWWHGDVRPMAGLADYVIERDIEILFGVASFHGTHIADIATAWACCIIVILPPLNCVRTHKPHRHKR